MILPDLSGLTYTKNWRMGCPHLDSNEQFLILTSRYACHSPTEVKNIITPHPYITQIMVDSHCEILWDDNSGAYLGCHPTENYAAGLDEAQKQAIMSQQLLRSKMIGLWIKTFLTTNVKCKLRALNYAFTFNAKDDRAAMFFVIVKMVQPDTHTG